MKSEWNSSHWNFFIIPWLYFYYFVTCVLNLWFLQIWIQNSFEVWEYDPDLLDINNQCDECFKDFSRNAGIVFDLFPKLYP